MFSGSGFVSSFESIYFSGGLAPVQSTNGKMLLINKKGEPITDAIYDTTFPFSKGQALVSRDNLYGFIDNSGEEVIKCQFGKYPFRGTSHNSWFSKGLAMVLSKEENDNNLGYINKLGETVFKSQFLYASAFSKNYTMVQDWDRRYF